MQSKTKLPVTVKTRIGYDDVEDYESLFNFINLLKSTGVKTFIIHARKAMLGKFTPKQNLNIPPLKYEMVYKLKKDFKDLEIIINGGITSTTDIKNHLDKVDGVMIGRSIYESAKKELSSIEDKKTKHEMVKEFKIRKNLIVKKTNTIPGISCTMPEGAFYTMPNITDTKLSSKEMETILLEELNTNKEFCQFIIDLVKLTNITSNNIAWKSVMGFGIGETDLLEKVKKTRKSRSRKAKKRSKPRKKKFKAPKLLEDGDGKSLIKVSDSWANQAYVNKSKYQKKYKLSIKENDKFWAKEGKRISWIKKYTKIKDVKYSKTEVKINWYYDGTLNASANCIDRHLKKNKDKTAIIWVGDDPKVQKKISYKQLHQEVSKAANGLKEIGVKKGDRVTIYLTMIPELAYTCLLYTSDAADE